MRTRLPLVLAAALLAGLAATVPARAQGAGPAAVSPDTRRPLTLMLSAGRPGVLAPDELSNVVDGELSLRGSLSLEFAPGLGVGVTYDRSRYGFTAGDVPGSTVHTLALTGTATSAPVIPVRLFAQLGPALVVYSDDADATGAGQSATVAGATVGAGLRLRLTGRADALAAATALVAASPDGSDTRVFSGLHLGLALGL